MLTSAQIPVFLACLTLGTTPPPSLLATTTAPSPAGDRYPAHLEIDTSGLSEKQDAEVVAQQARIFDRDVPTMMRGHVDLADNSGDNTAELRILFAWEDYDAFIYRVSIEADVPGKEQQSASFTFRGDEYDLMKRLEEEVPTIEAWFENPQKPASSDLAPEENGHTDPTPPNGHDPNPPDKPGGRPILWTGVALSVVGAALLPTGVVLHLQTKSVDEGLGQTSAQRRHPIALTGTLMGVGAAALGTGVALIIVGSKKGRKSRSKAVLAPTVSPRHVGVSLHGRF